MDYMVKRVTLVFGVMFSFTAAWPGRLLAQTNVVGSGLEANRYLLVVETSRTMQRRADGVLKAVQDLLVSGMKGQFRSGDTLGIWTFNEDIYTGRFPLQRWSAEAQRPLARSVLAFLQSQTYEKRARLDKVLPALDHLITKSAFITVILVSSGEEKIQGTPFDERINDSFKQWRDEQRKAGMPLVTVLRAKRGRVTDYSVNAAPFPVEMPPLPPELQAAAVAGKKPAAPPQTATPAVVPSLIVHGKKPEAVGEGASPSAAGASGTNAIADAPDKPATEPVSGPITNQESAATGASNSRPTFAPATQSATTPPATNEVWPPATDTNVGAVSPLTEAAAAVPQGPAFGRRSVWVAGFVLAGVALGVGVLLLRRKRTGPAASLITRSLDRENKE